MTNRTIRLSVDDLQDLLDQDLTLQEFIDVLREEYAILDVIRPSDTLVDKNAHSLYLITMGMLDDPDAIVINAYYDE